jgi:hypothetical protein
MTIEEAREASQTLEDVFTPEGDAVVIARVSRLGPGFALVTGHGQHHLQEWVLLSDLRRASQL